MTQSLQIHIYSCCKKIDAASHLVERKQNQLTDSVITQMPNSTKTIRALSLVELLAWIFGII